MTKLAPIQFGQPPADRLRGVNPSIVSQPSQSADPAKIAKAANNFEAMAIGQLLQPMFDTVDTAHSAFGGGSGDEAWKPMLVQAFATQIAPTADWAWPSLCTMQCFGCREPIQNEQRSR